MAVAPNAPRLVKLTDDVGFSVQPTIDELKSLHKAGFHSVINMRFEDEKGIIREIYIQGYIL